MTGICSNRLHLKFSDGRQGDTTGIWSTVLDNPLQYKTWKNSSTERTSRNLKEEMDLRTTHFTFSALVLWLPVSTLDLKNELSQVQYACFDSWPD